jgi:hypothetical protein
MKYKISIYGSGYNVHVYKLQKKIFNRLKSKHEDGGLNADAIESILNLVSSTEIFDSMTYLQKSSFLGLHEPLISVVNASQTKVISQHKIDLSDIIDSDYDSFYINKEVAPFLFFPSENLKGITWEAEIDIEEEFDLDKVKLVVQEYPESFNLVIGVAYDGAKLNHRSWNDDNDEPPEHDSDEYFFSDTPFFEKLELNGLTSLSNAAAESFSKHRGTLCVNGLQSLTDSAAEFLSNHVGVLELKGLVSLSDIAVEHLFGHTGKIILSDSISLSDTSRQRLSERETYSWANNINFSNSALDKTGAENKGIVNMDNLTFLSDQEALDISLQNGRTLRLNGLTELTEVTANLLAEFKGDTIELSGLKELSDEVAEELGAFEGDLSLNGLIFLSDRGAKALSNGTVSEEIEGVTITEKEAKQLAETEGDLDLNHLTFLSAKVAFQLSKHKEGALRLNGLKKLSANAADCLGAHPGDLLLNGLSVISPNIAGILASATDSHLQPLDHALCLNGLTALSEETAKALSKHRGWLDLNGLINISDEVAIALSKHKGPLYLNGLTALSDEAAEMLANHNGQISLCGFTNLSDKAIEALSKHNGNLILDGLISISDQAALAISRRMQLNISDDSKTVSLDELQTVSDFALRTICEFIENGCIRIDSPAIFSRVRKCIDELNETRFEKVFTKDLLNQKVIGRKLAVRASRYWSEDFTDEETGETTSLNLNETIVEAGKKLTKKHITNIMDSGVEFIFLERERV